MYCDIQDAFGQIVNDNQDIVHPDKPCPKDIFSAQDDLQEYHENREYNGTPIEDIRKTEATEIDNISSISQDLPLLDKKPEMPKQTDEQIKSIVNASFNELPKKKNNQYNTDDMKTGIFIIMVGIVIIISLDVIVRVGRKL
jgi:hypothetical protein